MPPLYIDLAVPLAVDKLFTYTVPPELHDAVQRGVRAVAPFGKRTVVGVVVKVSTHVPQFTSSHTRLRAVLDILDLKPIISDELFHLAEWMADYYFVSLGEVLKSLLVQGALRAGKRSVRLDVPHIEQAVARGSWTKMQQGILRALSKSPSMSVSSLQKKVGTKSIYATLNALERDGYLSITEEQPRLTATSKTEKVIEIDEKARARWREWLESIESEINRRRASRQIEAIRKLSSMESVNLSVTQFLKDTRVSLSTLRTLERKQLVTVVGREVSRTTEYDLYPSSLGARDIVLNSHQKQALEIIQSQLEQNRFHTFMLHGVTGSGKTQVYIEAIREALRLGKTAIVLVPEISLTPQIVRRFKYHFGDGVVAIHSRMSLGERYDAWRLAREGRCDIVIGPRSAIFAPLRNLGLIVVDEEQEASYKQFDQTPRYHARDVAIMRASYANAVVVLGSATPSFESYTNAVNRKYTLIELPERVDNARLPRIEIVDMTAERQKRLSVFRDERLAEFRVDAVKARASKRKFEFDSISDLLKEKIGDRLRKKEGIILLQNRRGFAPFIECPDCGYVEMCDNCNITLTYHLAQHHLRCHYCGFVKPAPDVCPECRSIDIQYRGFGTQRVEEDLKRLFPDASMIRMDLDTTSRKGSHDTMLKKFSEGDVDILLGTQMVAKGLDFSRVTLVGVISADTQMLLPDFRSAERTFQLLTQVAGRAGRSTLAGEVVIQTFQPQHYSLKHVLTHGFNSFYEEEQTYRKELDYPPYSRLVLIEFKGKQENEVLRQASQFAELLKQHSRHFITLGPAEAVIARLRGFFRCHIVIKDLKQADPSGTYLHQALRKALDSFRGSGAGKSKSVQLILDVDPVGMM